jgi:hypothetical protein
MPITLYRGHADSDFLRTENPSGVCFYEAKELARLYGKGLNDAGNPKVANGFLTTVEFHGVITNVRFKGLDLRNNPNLVPQRLDALRTSDHLPVVIVVNIEKLKNHRTELA